jgi:hypothetical protein
MPFETETEVGMRIWSGRRKLPLPYPYLMLSVLRFLSAAFVAPKRGGMTPETQQFESPYCVRIETDTGQSSTVPIAILTPKQLEIFLQSEFKRLAQEAGVKGARIHVERAVAADYEQVLREVAACLFSSKARAA